MVKNRSRRSTITGDTPNLVRLWLLRLLIPLGLHKKFIERDSFIDDALAEVLGLGHWIDPVDRDFETKAVRVELRELYQDAEVRLKDAVAPSLLQSNIARLSALTGLSEIDCRILELAVLIQNEQLFGNVSDWLGQLSSSKVFHVISLLLDLPESSVREALSGQGVLTRSGLVSVERHGIGSLSGKLILLSDEFADIIYSAETDPIGLLRDTVSESSPAHLCLDDYAHVRDSLEILRPYLRNALAVGRRGVNIFLHGAPGTGKSQLAKALAGDLGCELFEVASEDCDGDPVNGEKRLRAFRAAQSFFAQRRAVLLFDEVEDVFNDGDRLLGRRSTAQLRKAWINRMLEENPVPTLWLSNSICDLDPAFVRRFDMVFELPVPPQEQRSRIIRTTCGDLLDAASVNRLAQSERLAPAVVAKAASVVRSIQPTLADGQATSALVRLVSSTLEAQGHRPLTGQHLGLPDIYDPDLLNADADLSAVAAALAKTRSGRLCLFGPPGTGKTAYGRWLATRIGMPLVVRRASDMMSMWVGGSEKNVARVFRQAAVDGALLMIDEVDSFLQDRRGAHAAWEVTLVNEMLTQMEEYPGLFIASTNLMSGIDQAALRRFDLKVRFGYLKPEQAAELLRRHCVALALEPPGPGELARLSRKSNLTPGDFATVARRSRLSPPTCVADLVAALESECSAKEGSKSVMGFLPT